MRKSLGRSVVGGTGGEPEAGRCKKTHFQSDAIVRLKSRERGKTACLWQNAHNGRIGLGYMQGML